MLRLIEKDLLFNRRQALLQALVAVLVPLAIRVDRGETRLILLLYIVGAVLANSHLLARSCDLDDGAQTARFLSALPVTRTQRVLAKYALALLSMGASILLTSLTALALGLHPGVRGALIAVMAVSLYYAVFLGVFFRAGYGSAERANAALMMLTIASAFAMDRGGLRLDEMAIAPAALAGGAGLCLLILLASMGASILLPGRRGID